MAFFDNGRLPRSPAPWAPRQQVLTRWPLRLRPDPRHRCEVHPDPRNAACAEPGRGDTTDLLHHDAGRWRLRSCGDADDPRLQCTDPQNIQATVPVGTIMISTPYTPARPLDLGDLVLQPTGANTRAVASFAQIVITDSSAGNKGYTVSALSSDLVDGRSNPGSTINSQNVGLTGLSAAGSAGFSATVVTSDNPAADPAVGQALLSARPATRAWVSARTRLPRLITARAPDPVGWHADDHGSDLNRVGPVHRHHHVHRGGKPVSQS